MRTRVSSRRQEARKKKSGFKNRQKEREGRRDVSGSIVSMK